MDRRSSCEESYPMPVSGGGSSGTVDLSHHIELYVQPPRPQSMSLLQRLERCARFLTGRSSSKTRSEKSGNSSKESFGTDGTIDVSSSSSIQLPKRKSCDEKTGQYATSSTTAIAVNKMTTSTGSVESGWNAASQGVSRSSSSCIDQQKPNFYVENDDSSCESMAGATVIHHEKSDKCQIEPVLTHRVGRRKTTTSKTTTTTADDVIRLMPLLNLDNDDDDDDDDDGTTGIETETETGTCCQHENKSEYDQCPELDQWYEGQRRYQLPQIDTTSSSSMEDELPNAEMFYQQLVSKIDNNLAVWPLNVERLAHEEPLHDYGVIQGRQLLCKLGSGSFGDVLLCASCVKHNNCLSLSSSSSSSSSLSSKTTSSSCYCSKPSESTVSQTITAEHHHHHHDVDCHERQEAVKVVRLDRLRKIKNALSELDNEIRVWKSLPKHPNLVQFFTSTFSRRRQKLYIFMEAGLYDLHYLLTRSIDEKLATLESRLFCRQMLQGLSFLHKNNVCHKDVKPANLLICQKFLLKLCDFGTCETMDPHNPEPRQCTNARCTPQFQAPELATGTRRFDGRKVDVWASGITLFKMITGRYLFDAQNIFQLLTKIENDDVKIPADVNDEALRKLMFKMLNKNPDERSTIDEILQQHHWLFMNQQMEISFIDEHDPVHYLLENKKLLLISRTKD